MNMQDTNNLQFIGADEPPQQRGGHRHGKRGGARGQYVDPAKKPFIAWDMEGQNLMGKDKKGRNRPQDCVLFGCATSNGIVARKADHTGITTAELVEFIIDVGKANPTAFHIGYGFAYDMNMIIRSLSLPCKRKMNADGYCSYRRNGRTFVLSWKPRKYISITERLEGWSPKNHNKQITVTIYDVMPFFGSSFVDAVEGMVPKNELPEQWSTVREGKKHRGGSGNCEECKRNNKRKCPFDRMEYVLEYWEQEIAVLASLAGILRTNLYEAGFHITEWYGPGVLAREALRKHEIDKFMGTLPEAVQEACQYAYSGGRFEKYSLGRFGGPVYSWDLQSAYPSVIAKLPSLAHGEWIHKDTVNADELQDFALYHLTFSAGDKYIERAHPFFYRNKKSLIFYPIRTIGWYWGVEVKQALRTWYRPEAIRLHEGWEFVEQEHIRPFSWIEEMYAQRKAWKAEGNQAQMALKLCMNSIYGKLAQRVGWDEVNKCGPKYHNLAWAGFITASVRALIYEVIGRAELREYLIAVETDGFYTTANLEDMKCIKTGTALGDFEMKVYDEAYYFQNGVAWLKHEAACKCEKYCTSEYWEPRGWEPKRRGLDASSFQLERAQKYAQSLHAIPSETREDLKAYRSGETAWPLLDVKQTRFIGLSDALNRRPPGRMHCVWLPSDRDMDFATKGKRVHYPWKCPACKAGKNAYDMPHLTVAKIPGQGVNKDAKIDGDGLFHSYKHKLPWIDGKLDEENRDDEDWHDIDEMITEVTR